MLVRRYVGSRCGVSRRLTSDCRRSASPMITCVYSISCGAVELALEQLRRAADAAQRILDLVREAADQLAIRLLLLEQALLARDLELLVDVAELEQQRAVACASTGETVQVRCSFGLPTTPSSSSCSVYDAPRTRPCRSPPPAPGTRRTARAACGRRASAATARTGSPPRDWRRSRVRRASSISTAVASSSSPGIRRAASGADDGKKRSFMTTPHGALRVRARIHAAD